MTVFSRRSFPLWGGLILQGRAVKLQGCPGLKPWKFHQFLVHQEQREQERLEALTPRRSTKSMSEAPAIQNEGAAGWNWRFMQDFIQNKTQFAHIPLPKSHKAMGKPTPPHDIPNRMKEKLAFFRGKIPI